MAISLHGLQERRRRLPDPLLGGPLHHGQAVVLHGVGHRSIRLPQQRQGLEHGAGHSRGRLRPNDRHLRRRVLLHLPHRLGGQILGGLVHRRLALDGLR